MPLGGGRPPHPAPLRRRRRRASAKPDPRPSSPRPPDQSTKNKHSTEKANGQAYEVFQALCPFCGGPNAPRSWTEAAPSDLAVPGVHVKKGEKSWIDGKPVWVFNYDDAKPAFGFDFRGFRDELRQAAPGLMIGKMITTPTNGTYNNGWNPSDRSVEQTSFILMQACASNGEYPSRPIDRVAL